MLRNVTIRQSFCVLVTTCLRFVANRLRVLTDPYDCRVGWGGIYPANLGVSRFDKQCSDGQHGKRKKQVGVTPTVTTIAPSTVTGRGTVMPSCLAAATRDSSTLAVEASSSHKGLMQDLVGPQATLWTVWSSPVWAEPPRPLFREILDSVTPDIKKEPIPFRCILIYFYIIQ